MQEIVKSMKRAKDRKANTSFILANILYIAMNTVML